MKKGIGIAFLLFCCVSCSNEINLKTASKKNSKAEIIIEDQVISASEKQQPVKDTVVEKLKQNTTSASLSEAAAPTSNASQSNDPFGDMFSSGGLGGNGSSNGTGSGTVSKIMRTQLTELDRSPFRIKQSVIIRLELTIDADGKVVSAFVDTDNTHTSDQELLNRVINAVKKEVRYNRVPGTPLMKVSYKVFIEGTEMPVYVN